MKKSLAEFLLYGYLTTDILETSRLSHSKNITEEQRDTLLKIVDNLKRRLEDLKTNGITK